MADCSQRQRPGDTQIGNVVDGKAKQCALGVAAVSSSQPVEQGLHAVRLERGVGERLLGDASAKLFQATGVRPDARPGIRPDVRLDVRLWKLALPK